MQKKHTEKKYILKTLYQWALASFIIVTLPLIFTISYTLFEFDNYNQQSQQTLFQIVNIGNNRIIQERLFDMERNIRQFRAVPDPGFFIAYNENREKFLNTIHQQLTILTDQSLIHSLNKLEKNENLINQKIVLNIKENKLNLSQNDLDVFDHLTNQAKNLLKEGEIAIAEEAEILSTTADLSGDKLILSALVSIFLAIALSFRFVNLLSRPIKDIAQAIHHLGEGGFEQPISIAGPLDLTELGIHLEWLRKQLNRLEFEKQQFITNVSHELKTPLATLKEGTDLLAENVVGELNTEQQEIIQLMRIGNITIHDLVQNLLEYQKTISTQIELNYSTFKVDQLINRVTTEYRLLLRSKNITVDSQLKCVDIHADYDKLKIIISNLISNAVKFSPQNGTIGLTLTSKQQTLNFMIEDQGPGIDKKTEKHIYTAFYQGSSPQGWKIKASGIGLALVKHYLDAHQGSIHLLPSNKKFCGARFSLIVPKKPPTHVKTFE